MRKTRDLFKKIRDQGNILYKDVLNRDRNGRDLTEAEDIKKRWQEYTEEVYKNITMMPITTIVYDHSPRARHPRMGSQVGHRKQHYKQS